MASHRPLACPRCRAPVDPSRRSPCSAASTTSTDGLRSADGASSQYVVVGVLTLGAAALAVVLTWSAYIRHRIADAEPYIFFKVSPCGGTDRTPRLYIHNRGPGVAQKMRFYVPGNEMPTWFHDGLLPYKELRNMDVAIPVPLDAGTARAQLVYCDRFGNEYRASRILDEHGYSIGDTDPEIARPKLTLRALWRLRHQV